MRIYQDTSNQESEADVSTVTGGMDVPQPKHETTTSLPRMRVLVVDDEPVIVDIISELLSEIYDVDKASEIEAAYSLLDANNYDVLITDYNMPVMSGTMLAEVAREKHPHCHVVIITGSDDIEDIQNESVSDIVMRKPIKWKQLLSALASFQSDKVERGAA